MTHYTGRDLERIRQNPDIVVVTDEDGFTTVQPRQGIRRITLDVGPSANRYWRMVNGRMVRSQAANNYKAYVSQICSTAGIQPVSSDVAVTLRIYRPRRSGDTDNYIKICLDALQGHFYHNDSQVVEIHAIRHDDPTCPRVEIEIREL